MTATEKPVEGTSTSSLPVLTGGTTAGASVQVNGTEEPFALSIPKIGAYRTADHRYYFNSAGPSPSVTTILKILDKPAVVTWAKQTVAGIAVDRWEEIGSLLNAPAPLAAQYMAPAEVETVVAEYGEPASKIRTDRVKKWLSGMPDYQADTAAKLGSGVHLLADMASRASESDAETFQLSEEEKPYLDAFNRFLAFLRDEGSIIVSSEKMVWSVDGYAGTYDLIIKRAGELWLTDIKTGKGGTYPEYALQLAAYGGADYIILENDITPYPMPKINRYAVLHLRPDLYLDTGWRLIEYPVIGRDYEAFMSALNLWKWKEERRFTKKILNQGVSP